MAQRERMAMSSFKKDKDIGAHEKTSDEKHEALICAEQREERSCMEEGDDENYEPQNETQFYDECVDKAPAQDITNTMEIPLCEDAPSQAETAEDDLDQSTEIERWIAANPTFRAKEVDFLESLKSAFPMTIDDAGNLQQPLGIGDWTVLLVIDRRFPKLAEDGTPCVKIYFVVPTVEELSAGTGFKAAFAKTDRAGNAFLAFPRFDKILEQYLSDRSEHLITKMMINSVSRFRKGYRWTSKERNRQENNWVRPTLTSSKYIDARQSSQQAQLNPHCAKVILSDRALIQIYNETQARITTETGGLLLGHYEHGIWYVVEASDPGWNAIFQLSHHEADGEYENHVCYIISRTYKYPLAFLGMWHRHPGSLDVFSSTDDETNSKYVDSCGNGCISALINYDPDFRITFYYVERADNGGVTYSQVDVDAGDDKFTNPAMMQIASIEDANQRLVIENGDTSNKVSKGRRECRNHGQGDLGTIAADLFGYFFG